MKVIESNCESSSSLGWDCLSRFLPENTRFRFRPFEAFSSYPKTRRASFWDNGMLRQLSKRGRLTVPKNGLATLPSHRLSLVLFIQPLLQRSEVIQNCSRIHLALAGNCFQGVRPRLAQS